MANDIIFVDGMKVKERYEGLLGVSIRIDNFKAFIEEYENNGYVNIDICKSRDKDSWYARLNTWKPSKEQRKATKEDVVNEFDGTELITDEEVVF